MLLSQLVNSIVVHLVEPVLATDLDSMAALSLVDALTHVETLLVESFFVILVEVRSG